MAVVLETETACCYSLHKLARDPQPLIPEGLYELMESEDIIATAFTMWLGRPLDQYKADFSIIIARRAGLSTPTLLQEDESTTWGKALNRYRRLAINQGLLSDTDQVVISCIANSAFRQGVRVETIIVASDFRRKNLGSSFMEKFDATLQQSGYGFEYGLSDPIALYFHLKRGCYPIDQLGENSIFQSLRIYNRVPNKYIPVVKFLSPELERLYVRPEFLRIS